MFSDFYINKPQQEPISHFNYVTASNTQSTYVSQNKPATTFPNNILKLSPQEIFDKFYRGRTPLFSADEASPFNKPAVSSKNKRQAGVLPAKNLSSRAAPLSKKKRINETLPENKILNLSPNEIIDKYYRGRTPLFNATEASTFNEPLVVSEEDWQAGEALATNLLSHAAPSSKKRVLEENFPTDSSEDLEKLDNQEVIPPAKRQKLDMVTESPNNLISSMSFEDLSDMWVLGLDSETELQQFELPTQFEGTDIFPDVMDSDLYFNF